MAETMRAVRLFGPSDVRCVETPKPVIEQENEVIIKVKACGVCGSDLERVMVTGAYRHPLTIGHEFAGEIVAKGDADNGLGIGDRVTISPLVFCGKCPYCRMGNYVLCNDYAYYGSRIDGAMAEYIKVRDENVLKIPDNVDFESASMTDPASVALHAIRKADHEPGQNAIVFGMGPIGLLAVQELNALGCRKVVAVDVLDEKLALAKELGAYRTINSKNEDLKQAVAEITNGEGFNLCFDFAGITLTQVQAIESAAKMGKVIYCGISYDDLVIPNAALSKILRGEINIMGAWNSLYVPLPVDEWNTALEFMSDRTIQTQPVISHRFRLEECAECFDMMYNHKEVFNKVLFLPEKE